MSKPPLKHAGRLAATAALVSLAQCAVGPDFHKPTIAPSVAYQSGAAPAATAGTSGIAGDVQRFEPGADIPGQWWELFHSPSLNTLVERARAHSPSLQAASQALKAANEGMMAQQGSLYPSISASFNPTRNKTSQVYSTVPNNNSYLYNVHTAQLTVSYVPDLWGGIRRQVEASRAQAEIQRYQLEAVYLTLSANVVMAAINDAMIRAQITATEDIIADLQNILASQLRQQGLGNLATADIAAQQALLAQAQASLPPLHQQLDQTHDLIATLCGDTPDVPTPAFSLAEFTLPAALPVSLPLQLIEHRPDILSASAALHAASAQVGVAISNRLPNVQLGATPGVAVAKLSELGTPGFGQWTIAAMITQPIFDGGTLMHQERGARRQLDEAAAQYRAAVLQGLQNVADSLHALQNDAVALSADNAAQQAADHSLGISRAQLALGDVSRNTMLTAQQTAAQARLTLIAGQAARLNDTVALFQSLGGGWWNRKDVDAKDAKRSHS